MTTAYNTCKAKLRKGKDVRRIKAPFAPELVCAMMDKALTKIKTIDLRHVALLRDGMVCQAQALAESQLELTMPARYQAGAW